MYVTGRLALLVALGVVPLILFTAAGAGPWAVAGVWVLLCAVLGAADVLLAADARTLEISRRLPERALRDQPVAAELSVRNLGRRTLRARVRDAWQPTAGAPTERLRLVVPPGERRAASLPLLPRRRGELRSEFVVIRSEGPLRLAGRQTLLAIPARLRVLPPFTSRRHLPSRLARLRELDGNTTVQVRGAGTEFDSLREYVRGDDVRSIDWRATARAGTTMLRTWRPERDRHVVIVIDTGRTAAARVGDGARLDAAMEAALLLSALAARAGDHVHLLMFDRVTRARVTRVDGAPLLPALVDAMAPVEPQLIDTDWDAAFAQVRGLTQRPALVVLLTAADDPEAARAFLASLPAVAARSRLLVATATDGPGDVPEREDAAAVYAAAAIERARSDADRVRAAVVRAGGDAVAASADDLPPLVADHYLALKAAGRL
ncbi:DUF58 domain-containing protein [Microbacterium testaceum]|uniref:DUF58 domain-containing protein n=1 Tax=Microbacterium testaceum TaxID=2033 RepID=UPI001D17813A|nr:DUF58 domain-containing protein [Microbacterium testaceum]MCC4249256.1 DUF58 domain-containing protein [Microbacterium testaceum]